MSTGSIAALLVTGGAQADSFTYGDFSDVTGLTLNPVAAQVGSVLRVVPNTPSLAGTAYQGRFKAGKKALQGWKLR